jgi:hypothetical protein
MDHLFTCSCGEVLVKSSEGVTKIRNKILVFRGDKAFAVCPGCGAENQVPVQLDNVELAKSRQPKLFLRDKPKLVLDARNKRR